MIENYEDITKQVKKVLSYSQAIIDPKIDEMMANWAKNKEDFYHAFGDKYILDLGPIEVHINNEAKREKFYNFVERFYYQWNTFYNMDFYMFLKEQQDGFFDNRVVVDAVMPDGTKIHKGTKLLRCVKYFYKNKDDIYRIQTDASMIIQENKVSGNLCLSIHPLDFLSGSENTYNWRSCQALDGEYRSGPMSYIGDGATFITYIKGEDEAQLPDFPFDVKWNSKKWRLLVEASESRKFLMCGRQYPMELNNTILDKIRDAYSTAFNIPDWAEWHDDQIDSFNYKNGDSTSLRFKYVPIRGALYKLNDIVKDAPNSHHYNDLLYSTCSIPSYTWSRTATTTPKFTIGSACKCIACGKQNMTIDNTMFCSDCASEYGAHCACCGRYIDTEDAIWSDADDDYICNDCYYDNYFTCENCGQVLRMEDSHYDEQTDTWYCDDCYTELLEDRRKLVQED